MLCSLELSLNDDLRKKGNILEMNARIMSKMYHFYVSEQDSQSYNRLENSLILGHACQMNYRLEHFLTFEILTPVSGNGFFYGIFNE